MMKAIRIQRAEGVPQVAGNPFDVSAMSIEEGAKTFWVKTGVKLHLDHDMTLEVRSLSERSVVIGWSIVNDELVIIFSGHVDESDAVARVYIVQRKLLPVRFLEYNDDGKRVITGEPIESRTEIRNPVPGDGSGQGNPKPGE